MKVNGCSPALQEQLTALVESGRIPHAMVLDGGTDAGRRALARELAKAVLCTGTGEKPCGACPACRKAAEDVHPDIQTVEPDAGRKTLTVDVIRRMREDAFILPNESDRKVYILPQADTMQDYAQNALLKILEEPPRYCTFILCCGSRSMLLPTVLSRTANFSLSASRETDGDDETRSAVLEHARELASAAADGNEFALLSAAAKLEKDYDLLPQVMEAFEQILRDAMVRRAGAAGTVSEAQDEARALSGRYRTEQLLAATRAAEDISAAVSLHANKNLTLTRLCSRISAALR